MQSYQILFDKNNLNIEDIKDLENLIKEILGRRKSADIKKLDNWTYLKHSVYRAKISDKARLFFLYIMFEGKETILVLRKDETHNYNAIKRSLSSSGVADVALYQLNHDTLNEEVSTDVAIVRQTGIFFHHQFVLLDESQNKALVQKLPLLLVGAAGTGKTLSLYQLLLHNAQRTEKPILFLCATERMCQQLQAQYEEENNLEKPKVIFKTAESLLFDVYREKIQVNDADFSEWLKKQKQFVLQDKDSKVLHYELSLLEALGEKAYFASGGRQSHLSEDKRKKLPGLLKSWKNYLEQTNRCDLFVCNLGLHFQTHYSQLFADELQNYPPAMIASLLKALREVLQSNHFVATFDDEQCLLSLPYMLGCIKRILHEIYGSYTEHYLPNTWRSPKEVVAVANHLMNFKHACNGGRNKRIYTEMKSALESEGLVSYITEEKFDDIKNEYGDLPNTVVIVSGKVSNKIQDEIKEKFNVCQILTPSQAIGLEYDTVILWNPFSSESDVWHRICLNKHKIQSLTEAEYIGFNQWLVGILRAKNEVFIYESQSRKYEVLADNCFGKLLVNVLPSDKVRLNESDKKLQWEKRVDEQLKIKNTQVASDIMRDYLGFNEVQIQERINHVSKRSNSLNIDVSNLKTKNIHTHLKKQNEKNNITKNEVVNLPKEKNREKEKKIIVFTCHIRNVNKINKVNKVNLYQSKPPGNLGINFFHYEYAKTIQLSQDKIDMCLGNEKVSKARLMIFTKTNTIGNAILALTVDKIKKYLFFEFVNNKDMQLLLEVVDLVGHHRPHRLTYNSNEVQCLPVASNPNVDFCYAEIVAQLKTELNKWVECNKNAKFTLIFSGCNNENILYSIINQLNINKINLNNVLLCGFDPDQENINRINNKFDKIRYGKEKNQINYYFKKYSYADMFMFMRKLNECSSYDENHPKFIFLLEDISNAYDLPIKERLELLQKLASQNNSFVFVRGDKKLFLDNEIYKKMGLYCYKRQDHPIKRDGSFSLYSFLANISPEKNMLMKCKKRDKYPHLIDLAFHPSPEEELNVILAKEICSKTLQNTKTIDLSYCLVHSGNFSNLVMAIMSLKKCQELIVGIHDEWVYELTSRLNDKIKIVLSHFILGNRYSYHSQSKLIKFGFDNHALTFNYEKYLTHRYGLIYAITNGNVDFVEKYLPYYDLEIINQLYATNNPANKDEKITMLYIASQKNFYKIVQRLLEMGADPNIVSPKVGTALYVAVGNNCIQVVSELLKAAADPNLCTMGVTTPLYIAAQNNNVCILNMLLEKGANPDFLTDGFGTPLYVAAMKGHVDIVKLLLKYNANINIPFTIFADRFKIISYLQSLNIDNVKIHEFISSYIVSIPYENMFYRNGDVLFTCELTPLRIAELLGHDNIVHLLKCYLKNDEHERILGLSYFS